MARFVLVHGAFGGAWCWEPVTVPLEALGHTVEALDLPGGGDDQTPVADVTLESCAERVVRGASTHARSPLSSSAYSMGGVVITQAAANCPERVASMIFVCAFMPADGQSLLDLTHLPEGKDDMIQANLVIEGDPPVAVLSNDATAGAIYNRCTEEQRAWAVARRRPQPVAPFADSGARRRGRAGVDPSLVRGHEARQLDAACAPAQDDPRAPVRERRRAGRRPRAVPVRDGRARRRAGRARRGHVAAAGTAGLTTTVGRGGPRRPHLDRAGEVARARAPGDASNCSSAASGATGGSGSSTRTDGSSTTSGTVRW